MCNNCDADAFKPLVLEDICKYKFKAIGATVSYSTTLGRVVYLEPSKSYHFDFTVKDLEFGSIQQYVLSKNFVIENDTLTIKKILYTQGIL